MSAELIDSPFQSLPELACRHAGARSAHPAVVLDDQVADYASLIATARRVAAALQRDGLEPGSVAAICAGTSIEYVATFLGCTLAGVAVAPLSPALTGATLALMAEDADARLVFTDASTHDLFGDYCAGSGAVRIPLDDPRAHAAWLAPEGAAPAPVQAQPDWPFNLIYSSGTTGLPKGILQPYGMRWAHVQRAAAGGYGPDCVTLLGTPLYSNTTLVSLLPTLALGGTVVLMRKFDAGAYLDLAQRHRATHTMLVPVQYQRILAHPDFDAADLGTLRDKFCTSAPFSAELKREVLRRWPGRLTEYYGMTEGGGRCELRAHDHPDKLHTVGRPTPGHEILLLDEHGRIAPPGQPGEIVGRSPAMMNGYHNRPEQTAEAQWFDERGRRYIRTGDIGRFDEDGFLILLDRKKDMIISGGFNIYPSDLEQTLLGHPQVQDAAVVGVPSRTWGETPVAFVQARSGVAADELLEWANARLGRMQRLAALRVVDELPRNAIGKVLKRELRDAFDTPL